MSFFISNNLNSINIYTSTKKFEKDAGIFSNQDTLIKIIDYLDVKDTSRFMRTCTHVQKIYLNKFTIRFSDEKPELMIKLHTRLLGDYNKWIDEYETTSRKKIQRKF